MCSKKKCFLIFHFFLGKSGTVLIDKKGDRTPIYELHNYQYGQKIFLCKFDTETHKCQISGKILWPDGGSSPPKDRPACGFSNEKCKNQNIFREGFVKEYLMGFIFTKVLFLKRVIRGVSTTTVSKTSKIEFFCNNI